MRRLRFVVPASLVLSVLSFCGSALANSTVNGKLASIEGKSDSLGAKANDEGNFSYLQSSGNGSMGGEYIALAGLTPKIGSHGLVLHLAAVVRPEIVVVSTVPEPGSMALFGTGILSLAGLIRRKLIRS